MACAATPLIFYVSSRYRLPFAVLLAVPAGVGLSELLSRRKRAIGVFFAFVVFSLGVPWIVGLTMPRADELWRAERASGYAQLAQASLKLASSTSPGQPVPAFAFDRQRDARGAVQGRLGELSVAARGFRTPWSGMAHRAAGDPG